MKFLIISFLLFEIFENCQCARMAFERILGGSASYPGEFPYQVSIQVYDRAQRDFIPICGGAILNPTTILSAAHCTLADPHGLYRIVAGEFDLSREEGGEQFRMVDQIVLHNGFDDFSYHNDVALYLLSHSTPLIFSKGNVGPLSLPPLDYEPSPREKAQVAGWGSDTDMLPQNGGKMGNNILHKIIIPFYPNEKCGEIYGEDFLGEMMLCAGNLDGGEDACSGDSGGPLVPTYEGKKIVAGIVSWGPGTGCGQSGYLGVYTRVSTFVPWIEYVMKVLGHETVKEEEVSPKVKAASKYSRYQIHG